MLTDSAKEQAKANRSSLNELTLIARLTGKSRKWMLKNLKGIDEVLAIINLKGWRGLTDVIPEFGPRSVIRLHEVLLAAGYTVPDS